MYIETSSNNNGKNVFVSWERTDILQRTNIPFHDDRFLNLTSDTLKAMGRFRIQLLLKDNIWSTRLNIPKNERYSNSSTQWLIVNLKFTVDKYGIKLKYDEIDAPHPDMCFY